MAAKLNLLDDATCKNATSEGLAIKKLHDGGGLYLWVYADGSKYWRLRYWVAGKEKSISLGVYPEVALRQARKRRDSERLILESNLDPAAERKVQKLKRLLASENSFEAVANEWYSKQLHTWVPHHASDVKRRLQSNIYPEIGSRPIGEIETPELLAVGAH